MSEEKRSPKGKIINTRCLVCSSELVSLNHLSTDYLVSGEEYPVERCSNCGFLFTNRYPLETDIGGYYKSEEYISHTNKGKGISAKLYHIVRSLMLSRKRRLISKYIKETNSSLNQDTTLLDIGCGTGHFVAYMNSHGWRSEGIERDKGAREYAKTLNGIKVSGTEYMESLPSRYYDVVTLWHVLEHFHDPVMAIKQITAALKSKGIVVIALPNNLSNDANHYGPDWAAWDVPRHLWHFTPFTLSLFAENHDLELIKKAGMPFDSFYVSLLSEKNRGSALPFVKGMFRGLISIVVSFFDHNRYSSIIYILRKKES